MKNIAIFSVPRSGSTWLGQIFNSSPEVLYRFQPNFSYTFPYFLKEDSNHLEIAVFYEQLLECKDPFVTGNLSISGKTNLQFPKKIYHAIVWKEVHYLFLAKTLLENSDSSVVGLVRSPLAVIASWINIPKEFDPSWDIMEQWRKAELKNQELKANYFGYEKWKEVAILFEQLKDQYADRFYLLRYDDLLQNSMATVSDLFKFTGLDLSDQTARFLEKSRSTSVQDAYGVFKNKRNDNKWETELPQEIIKVICDDLRGTTLEKYIK